MRRTTKYKAVRTLLAMELEETVPDLDEEASVQPSSGDTHPNDFDTRLVRPRNLFNSGRRSDCDISRHDRPLNIDNSGRQSNCDISRYDRPLCINSTGRQCSDLRDEEGDSMNDASITNDLANDNDIMHIVDVGEAEIDTRRKSNVSSLCSNANGSTRESRPRIPSSGRRSIVNFDNTWCDHRSQPDCSGRRSP